LIVNGERFCNRSIKLTVAYGRPATPGLLTIRLPCAV
jgi:hypothetical protein